MFPYDATLEFWRKKPLIFLVNFLRKMFSMQYKNLIFPGGLHFFGLALILK
jgi:hypothetical protein